jgi:hypothetical protein
MTPRGVITRIAKMVGQELASGAPSRATFEAGEMLARAGIVPDLLACLVAETRRPRPAARMVEAYAHLLESALTSLSMAGNGGDATARAALDEVRAASDAEMNPTALMLVLRAFAQAGVEPGNGLRDAALAMVEAEAPPGSPAARSKELGQHLADVAQALGNDPFAIHAEMAAAAAALPAAHRATMAAELAASDVPAARDAALGFLLDPDPAPGAAMLTALAARARRHAVPSRVIERLVTMRPWLAPARRPALDAAIRALRGNAEAPAPAAPGAVQAALASLCDGAGAQSLFALLKRGRRFDLVSVLVKAEEGVAGALLNEGMSKREADAMEHEIRRAAEAVDVPLAFITQRLADALAINLAQDTPPPFDLLRVVEALGVGVLQPAELPPSALAAQLLEGLPPERTDAEATRNAHRNATAWPAMFGVLGSWFEAGEEIETLLRPMTSPPARIAALIADHLPRRRLFWAERCAWMAATLKPGKSPHQSAWIDFALIARDLAGTGELADMPLMRMIAESTAEPLRPRQPPSRPAKPRRR